jgi:predicted SPOUT superfamily RNA methylase MTH1
MADKKKKKGHLKEGAEAVASGTDAQEGGQPGRRWTVSMAVPGSMIENTQNLEFATFVAGQVARTAAIYNVDEVVVIDDTPQRKDGTVGSGSAFLARILQYVETPQYLRKALIPMHPDLRLAGLLPPLDAPHHMRATEWKAYREGVVMQSRPGSGSYIDIGLDRTAYVQQQLPQNQRVTLFVGDTPQVQFMQDFGESMILGKVRVA